MAQISAGEMIEIDPRSVLRVMPTLGLDTTVHPVPFQCSTSVWSTLPLRYEPEAHTSPDDPAAITSNLLLPGPTLGLGTTLQAVPFQCSVRVLYTPPLVS